MFVLTVMTTLMCTGAYQEFMRWVMTMGLDYFGPEMLYSVSHYAIWLGVYYFWALLFLFIDVVQPWWSKPYVIQQPRRFDINKFYKAIPLVTCNMLLNLLFIRYVGAPHQTAKEGYFSLEMPTWQEYVYWFAMSVILEDIFFYATHRLAHENTWLYQNVHKIHHQWKMPCAFVAIYAHPLEHIFVNMIPASLGVTFFSRHLTFDFHWYLMACTNTCLTHSGYHFPIQTFTSEEHDWHHERFTENYAIGILDELLKTNVKFLKSIGGATNRIYMNPWYFPAQRKKWLEENDKTKKSA